MLNRRIVILASFVLALGCVMVRAEPRIVMPDDPAGKEVREAAAEFFAKIGEGDARGAKELFVGEGDQAELLAAYVDWVNSFEALTKAVKDRFGESEEGKGVPPIGRLILYIAERQQEKFLVLNGDCASIAADDKLFDEGMELRRINGKWKVTHLNCDHRVGGMEKVLQAYVWAAKTVGKELREGKFASSVEVMAALSTHGKKAEQLMQDRGFGPPRALPAVAAVKWAAPDPVELGKYWGKTLFSPEIKKLLSSMPGTPHLFILPESARLTGEEAGMSLVFNSNGGLKIVTLFGEGTDGCRQYPGRLPNGLAFAEKRKDVEAVLGRPNESGAGGAGFPYHASYPQLGLTLYYAKELLRDPENPVAQLLLSPPRKDVKAAAAKRPAVPRLTFRLVTTDPAIAADEMFDPSAPAGDATIRVLRDVLLDETSIAEVRPTYSKPGSRDLAVGIEMTDEGARKLKAITGANVGRKLAIILDGEVLMAPNIQSELSKSLLITMGQDPKNKEASTMLGRIHAAVFTLPLAGE